MEFYYWNFKTLIISNDYKGPLKPAPIRLHVLLLRSKRRGKLSQTGPTLHLIIFFEKSEDV